MKSVATKREGQSAGRSKTDGRMGMTTGQLCRMRVGQVGERPGSPKATRSFGRPCVSVLPSVSCLKVERVAWEVKVASSFETSASESAACVGRLAASGFRGCQRG